MHDQHAWTLDGRYLVLTDAPGGGNATDALRRAKGCRPQQLNALGVDHATIGGTGGRGMHRNTTEAMRKQLFRLLAP